MRSFPFRPKRISFPHHLSIVCVVASLLSCAATASAEPAMVTIQVNDEEPVIVIDMPEDESGGVYQYFGEYADADGQWLVIWDKSVNPNPASTASVLGNVHVQNNSDEPIEFTVTFETALCPVVEEESLSGAFVVVTLQTDEDGGQMENIGDESIWSLMADGEVAQTIYDSPFLLASSGKGTASLSGNFGTPFPSAPTLPIEASAGIRYQFIMTAGEAVDFNNQLFIGADPQYLVECTDGEYPLGDLNEDGVVNALDLFLLFVDWGRCVGCPADLNGDGVVDGLDLFILLGNWG